MSAPETLFDHLYRASFRNETLPGWTNNAVLRDALRRARRFALTDDMSSFLGELSINAFVGKNPAIRPRIIENLRIGARLPHDVTWVEYNLRRCQQRMNEIREQPFIPEEVPQREGWLLMRHPGVETAHIAHIITRDPELPDLNDFDTWTFPVAYAWTVDRDTVLPWRMVEFAPGGAAHSEMATGVIGYKTDRIGICRGPLLHLREEANSQAVATLIKEWVGVGRRIFTFLATINDLPVEMQEVRAAKGFVAKGRYRKYLNHSTIHIQVPQKRWRVIARKALTAAHVRAAHGVRGHWRNDWRHPYSRLCEHIYDADETHRWCVRCHGREAWIPAHQRGTAQLALITQDYVVEKAP